MSSYNRLRSRANLLLLKNLLELFGLENDWMMVDSISASSSFSLRLPAHVVPLFLFLPSFLTHAECIHFTIKALFPSPLH